MDQYLAVSVERRPDLYGIALIGWMWRHSQEWCGAYITPRGLFVNMFCYVRSSRADCFLRYTESEQNPTQILIVSVKFKD